MRGEEGDAVRRSWHVWLGIAGLLVLALQAGRAAVVAALGERRPALAAALWPSHPSPKLTLALTEIGAAAGQGRVPPPSALDLVRSAGRVDPLNSQPLLVTATGKLAAGDSKNGERLLQAALQRDPRSTAAHFLLADLYIRQERIGDALIHVGVLGRRLRGTGTAGFAGALATYLEQPGALAKVAPVLASDVSLRAAVMNKLSTDPAAAATLRALVRRGDADESWFRIAFERQLAAGDLDGAHGLLAGAAVRGGGTQITDWAGATGSGPLAWRLPSGPDGLAEPDKNDSLGLIYYGRSDASIAEHLLLLPAGRYRLAARFAEFGAPGTFEWRLTCVGSNRQLMSSLVRAARISQLVEVPGDCPAQRLALWGRMGEFPRTTAATLVQVSLAPARGVQ